MMTTTCTHESTAPTISSINLLLAFELGERTWKLGFTTGLGQRPRMRAVPAGAVDRVREDRQIGPGGPAGPLGALSGRRPARVARGAGTARSG